MVNIFDRIKSFYQRKEKENVAGDGPRGLGYNFQAFYAQQDGCAGDAVNIIPASLLRNYIIRHASRYADQPWVHNIEADANSIDSNVDEEDVPPTKGQKQLQKYAVDPGGAFLVFEGRTFSGNVDLEGAEIIRPLRFRNCTFKGKFWAKDANFKLLSFYDCTFDELRLHRAIIEKSLILNDCDVYNGVQMRGARIGQSISFNGSVIGSKEGPLAIDMENSRISHSIYMSKSRVDYWDGAIDGAKPNMETRPFRAHGVIRLSGVEAGGSIDFRKAVIEGKKIQNAAQVDEVLTAIEAVDVTCGASIHLSRGFQSLGEVNFKGARVGLVFDCAQAAFNNGGDRKAAAINLRHARIGTEFLYYESQRIQGDIDLIGMQTKTFHDDIASWNLAETGERQGNIKLNGLVYDRLVEVGNKKDRLKWLEAQPRGEGDGNKKGTDFRPQPWTQLANILDSAGNRSKADWFRYLRDVRRYKSAKLSDYEEKTLGSFVWYEIIIRLHYWLNGFSRRPLRAFKWGIPIILIAWCIFGRAYDIGMIKPAQPIVTMALEENFREAGLPSVLSADGINKRAVLEEENSLLCPHNDYEKFNPSLYSLDLFLPFLDFNQVSHWEVRYSLENDIRDIVLYCADKKPKKKFGLTIPTFGIVERFFPLVDSVILQPYVLKTISIFEQSAGWLLTLMSSIAFTGLLRQSQ